MIVDDKYRSRKLALAIYFAITDAIFVAAGADPVLFNIYVFAQGVILGLYGATNVADKFTPKKETPK